MENEARQTEGLSFSRIAYRQLVRNKLAMAGFAMVFVVATVGVFVPLLANDKPYVIHTALPDEYDEAYASVLDAHDRAISLAKAGQSSHPEFVECNRAAFANLRRMERQLAPEYRTLLDDIRRQYANLFSAGFDAGAWDALRAKLVAELDISKVRLVPHYYFPLFRSLRPLEIFFMALWFAAVVQWLVRRRSPPTWGRARTAAALAALVAATWHFACPQKIIPVGYHKELTPQASLALYPPVFYGETEIIIEDMKQPPTWLMPREKRGPNPHLLGTDMIGRDVLSRMLYGARIAMIIGFVAVSIYVTIGVIVGSCAGFFRGRVDIVVSRLIEIVICFPTLFLILIVLAYLRPSIINIMVVLGLTSWTGVARLTRGEFLRIGTLDYVNAIRALGGSNLRIIFRHILPNGVGPVLVVASFGIASAILVESALSFLGMGVPQPYASWGTLLNDGRTDIQGAWWLTVFPGFAIFLTVTAWNLFGEGLRDAIDPRLKQ
ncbi:MAG: ABC transporter permease [Candidatus Sumerlaeia bacterium]|nr:ABC transporter permease [Candidatus Sumerlaeia bacterium]